MSDEKRAIRCGLVSVICITLFSICVAEHGTAWHFAAWITASVHGAFVYDMFRAIDRKPKATP